PSIIAANGCDQPPDRAPDADLQGAVPGELLRSPAFRNPCRIASIQEAYAVGAETCASSGITSEACMPLGPCTISNLTRWPSFRLRNPCARIAEKCTNTSVPSPSGVMNPKPLASLNHFTVPTAISEDPSSQRPISRRVPAAWV